MTDPNLMRYMLMQQLMQRGNQTPGQMQNGPQMQARPSALGGAADVAQKIMLMRALQGQRPQAPPMQVPPPSTGPVPLPPQVPPPSTGPMQ